MERISREKRLIADDREFSASTKVLLPLSCVFLAFSAIQFSSCAAPFLLLLCSLAVLVSSYIWGSYGFWPSMLGSSALLLLSSPSVFTSKIFLIFFFVMINTGYIMTIFRKMELSKRQREKSGLIQLKAWDSHYEAFRAQCVEQLEEIKEAQEELSLMREEGELWQIESQSKLLDEDSVFLSLTELLAQSEKKCMDLEREVELLEQILIKASRPVLKARAPRKKKVARDSAQPSLF